MNYFYVSHAEDVASKMKLPMKICEVTKELYGYAKPVIDMIQAKQILRSHCIRNDELGLAHAIHILEERVARLNLNS